jgi:hypothetical protein
VSTAARGSVAVRRGAHPNAAARIRHLQQLVAAVLDHDGDAGRACVQAVLQQLFQSRRGAVDDLAGSHAVHHFWREPPNRCGHQQRRRRSRGRLSTRRLAHRNPSRRLATRRACASWRVLALAAGASGRGRRRAAELCRPWRSTHQKGGTAAYDATALRGSVEMSVRLHAPAPGVAPSLHRRHALPRAAAAANAAEAATVADALLVCIGKTCRLEGSQLTLDTCRELAGAGLRVSNATCMGRCGGGPHVSLRPRCVRCPRCVLVLARPRAAAHRFALPAATKWTR